MRHLPYIYDSVSKYIHTYLGSFCALNGHYVRLEMRWRLYRAPRGRDISKIALKRGRGDNKLVYL